MLIAGYCYQPKSNKYNQSQATVYIDCVLFCISVVKFIRNCLLLFCRKFISIIKIALKTANDPIMRAKGWKPFIAVLINFKGCDIVN